MSDEFCFIGGNVAENAGGGKAVKYGVTGQYIQGAGGQYAATGEIIQFGGKRIKDVTGYNMVQLMVGSEGTLGIFSKDIHQTAATPHGSASHPGAVRGSGNCHCRRTRSNDFTGKLVPTSIEFMDGFSFNLTAKGLKGTFPL